MLTLYFHLIYPVPTAQKAHHAGWAHWAGSFQSLRGEPLNSGADVWNNRLTVGRSESCWELAPLWGEVVMLICHHSLVTPASPPPPQTATSLISHQCTTPRPLPEHAHFQNKVHQNRNLRLRLPHSRHSHGRARARL
jgi:hypothetical protein